MRKAGMERGFAKNVKIDVCCADFLRSSDTGIKEFRIHERAVTLRLRPAWTKAAMQIANVRDFDIDAVHDSPLNSIIASWYSLSLPAFLIFLNAFFGMFGSRYSQKL